MKRTVKANINEVANWDTLYEIQGPTRRTMWNNRELTEDVSAVIPQNVTVLDVGAGPGLGEKMLLERAGRSDIAWTGMDFAPYIAAWALNESGVKWVDYLTADIRQGIPVADNSYDVVISTELLEHLEDPAAAVAEFARVARRRVIVSMPSAPPYKLAKKDSPYHLWAVWPADVIALLAPHGKAWTKITRTNRTILGVCDL